MAGFRNDTVYANNVDFSGATIPAPTVTTDGQLLIGSTVAPNIRVGNLTSTGGTIIITNGSGTINLEAASTGAFPWIDQGSSILLTKNTGYFVTAATTQTLPAAPAQGDVVKIVADTAGAVVVQANAGQAIRLGNLTSSVAGTMTSTLRGDCMELVFRAVTSTWISIADNGVWLAA